MARSRDKRSEKASRAPPIVAGRSCEGCTVCCKLLSVDELQKPQQQECEHCDVGVGCKIYEQRPRTCAGFYCGYLLNEPIGEEWKPSECGMVLHYEDFANRIVVHVDGEKRDAWRAAPFYGQIKNWATLASFSQGQVIVWEGLDAVAVLPDKEVNLGPVRADQLIITRERRTILGTQFDVILMDRDDPRIAGQQLPTAANPRTTKG